MLFHFVPTFAHVTLCNALWPDIKDLSSTQTCEAGVEHLNILFTPLLSGSTQWLATAN